MRAGIPRLLQVDSVGPQVNNGVVNSQGAGGPAYRDWCRVLADALFPSAENSDGAIYLLVDDEFLAQLPQGFTHASLARAVRETLHRPGPTMFAPIAQQCYQWRRDSDHLTPPPSLPTLACSILAASRMDADHQGAGHNYYLRLAQLLAPTEEQVSLWRAALALHFSDLKPRWEELREWMEARGWSSSITELPNLRYVGYPISQAVLRQRDRRVLTQFWELIDVEPARLQPDSGTSLLENLRRWLQQGNRGFSSVFQRFVLDPNRTDWMGGLLLDLASGWHGEVLDAAGHRVERLRLSAVGHDDSYRLFWASPDGMSTFPYDDKHLHCGHEVSDGARRLRFDKAPLVVLRFNDLSDAWEAGAIETWTPLMLVFREDVVQAVKAFATDLVGADKVNGLSHGQVGKTRWVVLDAISDQERLTGAAKKLGQSLQFPVLSVLAGGERPRARLVGGLRLETSLGRHVYLAGGEPDLAYPTGELGELVDVEFDGRRQQFQRALLPLPLSSLKWLEPGMHQGRVQGSSYYFDTVTDPEAVAGRPARRRVGLEPGAWRSSVEASESALVGATVPMGLDELHGASELTVWVPRAALSAYLIGPRGQCRQLVEPPVGALWNRAFPWFPPLTYQASRSWTQGWLAVQRPDGHREVRELRAVPPDAEPRGGDVDLGVWREVVRQFAVSGTTDGWRALVATAVGA